MPWLLNPGDTIALISPSISFSPLETVNVDLSVKYFEEMGFKVRIFPSVYNGRRRTISSDTEKIRDIHEAYKDSNIKALVAVHGGAGSLRLLESLNYELIRTHPKPLIGLSDTTAIQLAIYTQTGQPYVSGFLAEYDFRSGNLDSLIDSDFKRLLRGKKFSAANGSTLRPGIVEGTLLGGNLKTMTDLEGTPYAPPLDDSILLIEDLDEKPYKISLMLTRLLYNPSFKKVKGIILGRFTRYGDPVTNYGNLEEIVADFCAHTDCPMITGFNYSHLESRHVLTFGVKYRLDAGSCRLEQIA